MLVSVSKATGRNGLRPYCPGRSSIWDNYQRVAAAARDLGSILIVEYHLFKRARSRSSLLAWAKEVVKEADQTPAPHHKLLLSELEQLTAQPSSRLMVLMPPGSAKSTYASIIFPSWWFTQYPRSSVILASHSAGLTRYLSRRIRTLIIANQARLGFTVAKGNGSSETWSTTAGGEFCAASVRSAISGRRADLIIIDDPIKSQADAESETQRDHVWEWYKSDLTTRLRPGGRVVLIMTRWHRDDLGGQLLARSESQWRVLRLPALAETDDPLGRPEGGALWPEWEDREQLLRKRDIIGERAWAALFQQNPIPSIGRLFAVECLALAEPRTVETPPIIVRAWDLAATSPNGKNDPDWTVGLKLGRQADGRYIVLDICRIRGTPREVEELVVKTAEVDGKNVVVAIPEDPGQAGKSQMSYLTRQLAGFSVIAARETGSKATRAMPVASQLEAGNIISVKADWNRIFIDEINDFPYGRKDDQVDALVRAFTTINGLGRRAKAINLPLFTR